MKLNPSSLAVAILLAGSAPVLAQSVDPQCMKKNADGTETIDMAKCPDGKTPAAAKSDSAKPAATPDTRSETTGSTTPADSSLTVPPEALSGAKIISANDFIGKKVYTPANETVGDVNDIILSDNGKVQAVVLGVGGFLGIGEKDVAVNMNSISMVPDGNSIKLTINASKEALNAAPAYDRSKRTYIK